MENQVSDPLIGQVVDGRYDVTKRIATGGMATVYLALDRRLERDVALKIMHPHLAENADFVSRFRREARSAAKLAHSGVVAVHDQGQDGRVVYLAMEYVEGQTLRDLLNHLGALTPDEAFDVLGQVLAALDAAHKAHLVHRDVKPENVLVTADGTVKVADFGVARAIGDSTTSTGTVMGTVAYLSPELLTLGVADARTDVYASGILLFEMLTGTQPYTGDSPIHVAYQHVHDNVPAPSSKVAWIPPEIDQLVATLTARDPDNRPADAHEAGVLLAETLPSIDADLLQRRADRSSATSKTVTNSNGSSRNADNQATVAAAKPARSALARSASTAIPPTAKKSESEDSTSVLPSIALEDDSGQPHQARGRPSKRTVLLAAIIAIILVITGGSLWYFRTGPGAYTSVPDIVGIDAAAATTKIEANGLKVSTSDEFSSEVAAGLVMSSKPSAGGKIAKEGTVAIVISKGPDFRPVPAVLGVPAADAKTAIESAGLVYAEGEAAYSEEISEGFTISQSPDPDEQAVRESTVTVIVSLGREPIAVPQVTGMTTENAVQEIEAAGFTTTRAEDFSDTVEKGKVISQSPSSGTGFRNDAITIIISKGQDLVAVPDVVRMSKSKAQHVLEEAGLNVAFDESRAFFGLVYSQNPAAGGSVKRGTTITLQIG